MKSFYEYLEVPRDASQNQIEEAFRIRYIATIHLTGDDRKEHLNVVKAHEILSDPAIRKKYDEWLAKKEFEESEKNNPGSSDSASRLNDDKINNKKNSGKSKRNGIDFHNPFVSAATALILVVVACMILFLLRSKPEDVNKYTDYSPDSVSLISLEQPDIVLDENGIPKGLNDTVRAFEDGASPFSQRYGKGKFDKSSLSEFKIVNQSGRDAVVLLTSLHNKVIRNVFINRFSSYTIKSIPSGKYLIKVMMGNEWNPGKDNGPDNPKGGFMKNLGYSATLKKDAFDFTPVEVKNGIEYPTCEMTLHKVVYGNLESENISEGDFFASE